MPLMHSKTPKAFKKNIEIEMEHGKPQKQAVAIAYSVKRSAEHKKHMASGGKVQDCELCSEMSPEENEYEAGEESDNALAGYAEGGEVEDDGDMFEPRETLPASHPEKHQSGVHETNRFGTKGVSTAGADLRAGFDTKPEHKRVLSEMKSMKKPNLYAGGGKVKLMDHEQEDNKMSDGGELEVDLDGELSDGLGEELMGALERKDKKALMSCIEAAVMHCMNKG